MSHASHTSISSTRDYLPHRDTGDLTSPAQSASFTTDPMLSPITTSALPKPVLPDPTPSDNPELFDKVRSARRRRVYSALWQPHVSADLLDAHSHLCRCYAAAPCAVHQSTSHPNTHYHPEAKLSKKKRAKKLGLGYVAQPHGGAHSSGARSFNEHEKAAHERAEARDAALGTADEEEYEEGSDEEDDIGQDEQQSAKQHHENRVTGTEQGEKRPANKHQQQTSGEGSKAEEGQEGGEEQDKEASDNPSLIQRATNALSSAQQKATGVVSGVTSSVLSTAASVPVVGSLLSKVGLGGAKSDDASKDDSADKEGSDSVSEESTPEQTKQSKAQSSGDEVAPSKVGGQKEADTKARQGGGSESTSKEAAVKGGDEVFGKEGAQQGDSDGLLDKSRSKEGQKHVDNLKAK